MTTTKGTDMTDNRFRKMKPVADAFVITDVFVDAQSPFASAYDYLPTRYGFKCGWGIVDVRVAIDNSAVGIQHWNFPYPCTVVSVFRTRKEARAFLDEVLVKAGA
jgi:hypothetical protein